MGTRNLTMVINESGEVKVAQYGQWDGYPEGVGVGVLKFLQDINLVNKFKSKLSRCRLLDTQGRDKEFAESYDKNTPSWSNEPDLRTMQQRRWFETFISRDLSDEVLVNIANSEDEEIILKNNEEFGKDTVFCEWVYKIDFSKNALEVYRDLVSPLIKSFDLSNLPSKEEFLESFKSDEDE